MAIDVFNVDAPNIDVQNRLPTVYTVVNAYCGTARIVWRLSSGNARECMCRRCECASVDDVYNQKSKSVVVGEKSNRCRRKL